MASTKTDSGEIARGILLLGVFHIHALFALLDHLKDPDTLALGMLQVKLFAPQVVIFFALSGMTSKFLPDKTLTIVANRSLMLMLIAIFSHVVGTLIQHMIWGGWPSGYGLFKEVVKPIVYGTGYSTFVSWFFVVLAITRVFAFGWQGRHFSIILAIMGIGIAAATLPNLPDNLYEWRNWPAAITMFLLGTRISGEWRVPHWLGLGTTVAGLALTLINSPTLLTEGICLDCHPEFVAEPMVGSYGSLPVYVVQEVCLLVALLWLSRLLAPSPIGGFLSYIGKRSIKLLILHGWVILSVYGLAAYLSPSWSAVPLFLTVFLANTLGHVVLYELLAKPLDRFILSCSIASRRGIAAIESVWRRLRRLSMTLHAH